ncbi:hypothetical protein A3A01_02100 [Candidatus Nomurabacteria bacterium RIFCSPLOWO2_01_FULL_39_17]|uniref:Metal-dependent hydrolase n=1 Tax=Candidatus Nomurabacteria bacterium RIFCSPLOWO2_01_FULL_39_17 TaxID=1801770 RepID=A0A1F6WWL3_9BACT|nr:MAG: hypothetical protein A3A01_02100 [Candidatus Nomurabacteria bacterium RIFCSPLOWO2_01_FULL_39_17]
MENKNSSKKLVTHNGSFHTDDIFACATLSLLLEKRGESFEIIRTRDEEIIKEGDYVFDVGGVYDPEKNRFDHHQVGEAGKRDNGIEYSSFGLIWKKFGIEICEDRKVVDLIDEKLVAPIDAGDNGIDLVEKKSKVFPYLIQDFFRVMRPTWRETDSNIDQMFLKSVLVAKEILLREITYAGDAIIADEKILSIYQNTKDKRIIILDKNYAKKEILNKLPETFYIIFPREVDNSWGVGAIRKDFRNFENKKNLPKSWGGLRDTELQKITGVSDAIFCHRGLFLAVAKSKEGAKTLAEKALVESS